MNIKDEYKGNIFHELQAFVIVLNGIKVHFECKSFLQNNNIKKKSYSIFKKLIFFVLNVLIILHFV